MTLNTTLRCIIFTQDCTNNPLVKLKQLTHLTPLKSQDPDMA